MMRNVCILMLCANIFCAAVNGQAPSPTIVQEKYPAVRVTDWGQNTMLFKEAFWSDRKEEIVRQIGEREFEKVKANSGFHNTPMQMSIWEGKSRKNPKDYYEKMGKLKVYKIATITNIWNGKPNGKSVILKCPYSENKTWDSTASWETVYFVVRDLYIEEL